MRRPRPSPASARRAFPVFDATKAPSFFVIDPAGQRGIHCRFGMPGIIAESHFDGGACARVRNVRVAARAATPPPRARRAISPLAGRNFIFMTRGRKRYIISRPSECSKLAMLMSGPSARHSGVDWTTPEGIATLSNASALEVVLEAGDALYMPAHWFHFIVSLTVNVQCNARSGTPPIGGAPLKDCGFNVAYSEEDGVNTAAEPPPHHAAAAAAARRRTSP